MESVASTRVDYPQIDQNRQKLCLAKTKLIHSNFYLDNVVRFLLASSAITWLTVTLCIVLRPDTNLHAGLRFNAAHLRASSHVCPAAGGRWPLTDGRRLTSLILSIESCASGCIGRRRRTFTTPGRVTTTIAGRGSGGDSHRSASRVSPSH